SRRSLTAATWTTNPLPVGSPGTDADAGASCAAGGGVIGLTGSLLVAAGLAATAGALFADSESRIPDPGLNLSSTGSCPSGRLGCVSGSCAATGGLLVTAGARGAAGVSPDVGSVAAS